MAQLASSATLALMQWSDMKDPMSVWRFIRRDGCDEFVLPSILHQRESRITGPELAPLSTPANQRASGIRAWRTQVFQILGYPESLAAGSSDAY
jgi:hypothetical protein